MKLMPLILLTLISFSGCITSNTIEAARQNRRPQKVNAISGVYEDASGALIVNFTATLSPKQRRVPLHVRIPVDTLLSVFRKADTINYSVTVEEKKMYDINRMAVERGYRHLKEGYIEGINLEFDKAVLKSGYYPVGGLDTAAGRLSLPKFSHDFRYRANGKPIKARHIVLLYLPALPDQKRLARGYMVINIEPSSRKKYTRYGLVPLALVADVLTSPFQLLGLY